MSKMGLKITTPQVRRLLVITVGIFVLSVWLTSSVFKSPSNSSTTTTVVQTCVDQTLSSLTEEEKVGQLFLLGLDRNRLGAQEITAINTYHFGSVWYTEKTSAGVASIRAVSDSVQALATTKTTGGVGFFIAANQEGGLVQALQGIGFSTIPTASAQGTMDAPSLKNQAKIWGEELRRAGVNLNFAPVLDVIPPGTDSTNQPIGVLHRGYGNTPDVVSAHGLAFLEGMAESGEATTAKHFPGLGRVEGNTDFTATVVDNITTAQDSYLDPFRQAVSSKVPFTMIALAEYPKLDSNHLAVFSSRIMRGLLREQLGFKGVIMSDDLGETAAVADVPAATRALNFLSSGGNLIISKTIGPAEAMAQAVLSRTDFDDPFKSQVEASVRLILSAKETYGLLSCETLGK